MITSKSKFGSEIKRFGLIFMPINWVICLIVTLILYFSLGSPYALGYLLGSVTSYLTFGLHMKDVNDYGSPKANIIMKIFTNFGTRMAITAVILAISYFNNEMFNFICCAIGICIIKLFLFIFGLIFFGRQAKEEKKKLMSKKEEGSVVEEDEHQL